MEGAYNTTTNNSSNNNNNNVRPSVCFEVQKVIGMTIGSGNVKNYQVQWAPTWVSDLHLIGCQHLIEDFLQEQNVGGDYIQSIKKGKNDTGIILNNAHDNVGHREFLIEKECIKNEESIQQSSQSQYGGYSEEGDSASAIVKDSSWSENEYTTTPCSVPDNLSDSNVDVVILETKGIEGAHFSSDDNTNLNFEWVTKSVDETTCFSGETSRTKSNLIFNLNEEGTTDSDTTTTPFQNSHPVGGEKNEHVININSFNNMECNNNITKHKCITCRKMFNDTDQLRDHQIRYHRVEERLKQFNKLKKCTSSSTRSSSSSSKLDTTPTKEKPYQCGVCQQVFSMETKLLRHTCIRCPVCDKLFTHKNDYRKHSRTHSGEKPYQCSICLKSFRIKSSLKKHFEVHEGVNPNEMIQRFDINEGNHPNDMAQRININEGNNPNEMIQRIDINDGNNPNEIIGHFEVNEGSNPNEVIQHLENREGNNPNEATQYSEANEGNNSNEMIQHLEVLEGKNPLHYEEGMNARM